jgi:hypothetical protein
VETLIHSAGTASSLTRTCHDLAFEPLENAVPNYNTGKMEGLCATLALLGRDSPSAWFKATIALWCLEELSLSSWMYAKARAPRGAGSLGEESRWLRVIENWARPDFEGYVTRMRAVVDELEGGDAELRRVSEEVVKVVVKYFGEGWGVGGVAVTVGN